ncbi:Myb-like DNA-binding domain containing protein [Tritrichomonas foetus]|uniref:Myb-like DNA-binding domain containing protein n=1 Tax=Tritrichomonas foetus TaxID=1144522 RepID=A0A1J4KWK8_9EUKA|nr:Myb-like DNA-binding domain containing protein [Tritrichomonas foetus]|eukprot:OHT15673.1 Myb-like DNA-binding domain containing protein [Tritrichomonas foetus]
MPHSKHFIFNISLLLMHKIPFSQPSTGSFKVMNDYYSNISNHSTKTEDKIETFSLKYPSHKKCFDSFMISPDDINSRKHMSRWTQEEDMKLLNAVHIHGCDNWTLISQIVGGGRTRSQCAQRWSRGLRPGISHDEWSLDEDQKLLMLVEKYGKKNWVRIASCLGDRCDVQCRYRYQKINPDKMQSAKAPSAQMPLPPISILLNQMNIQIPSLFSIDFVQ